MRDEDAYFFVEGVLQGVNSSRLRRKNLVSRASKIGVKSAVKRVDGITVRTPHTSRNSISRKTIQNNIPALIIQKATLKGKDVRYLPSENGFEIIRDSITGRVKVNRVEKKVEGEQNVSKG